MESQLHAAIAPQTRLGHCQGAVASFFFWLKYHDFFLFPSDLTAIQYILQRRNKSVGTQLCVTWPLHYT